MPDDTTGQTDENNTNPAAAPDDSALNQANDMLNSGGAGVQPGVQGPNTTVPSADFGASNTVDPTAEQTTPTFADPSVAPSTTPDEWQSGDLAGSTDQTADPGAVTGMPPQGDTVPEEGD